MSKMTLLHTFPVRTHYISKTYSANSCLKNQSISYICCPKRALEAASGKLGLRHISMEQMHFSLSQKVQRYRGLIKEVANWPSYLLFKVRKSHPSFTFKLRNTNSITVLKNMLPPFKEIFFDQVYLRGIPEELLKKEELTILDIGANVGFFSFFMLFRHPKAKIYAFEPMPFNFNMLQQYKANGRFHSLLPVNKAVTGKGGKLLLNHAGSQRFTTMSSIFQSQRKEQLEVESTTLALIFAEYGLHRVDFLKMDCEGSEYDILYKAPPALYKKIHAMCIETHRGQQATENTASLAAFLRKQGYCLLTVQKGKTGYIWAWKQAA